MDHGMIPLVGLRAVTTKKRQGQAPERLRVKKGFVIVVF